jgi:hypothetical protein
MPLLQSQFTLPLTTYQPPVAKTALKGKPSANEPDDTPVKPEVKQQQEEVRQALYRQQVLAALKDWYKHMTQKFGPPRVPIVP